MRSGIVRLGIAEYGTPKAIVPMLATATGLSPSEAEALLRRHGERLQRRHGLRDNPIEVRREGVVAKGIAGVVALTPRVEMEVRPKFALPGSSWQSDLVFLAIITRHGRIDSASSIASAITGANNLADLIARVIVTTINRNHRSPLRTRRSRITESFEPDGEMDVDALLNPGEEGWRQRSYAMSRDNEYWSTIHHGARVLEPHVRNPETSAILRHAVMRWGRPTAAPSRFHRILPPRLSMWQSAYDLAFDILRSASVSPGDGRQVTFEFTLDMWRTWETLIERGLILACGAAFVDLQRERTLGTSMRLGRSSKVVVIPDAVVDAGCPVVIDAKYKGRWRPDQRTHEPISAADRYEAMAFMMATGIKDAVLLYPSLEGASVDAQITQVQEDRLPTGTLRAVAIGVVGLSQPQGMARLRERLAEVAAIPVMAPVLP